MDHCIGIMPRHVNRAMHHESRHQHGVRRRHELVAVDELLAVLEPQVRLVHEAELGLVLAHRKLLLRGVNVAGANRLPMPEFRQMLTDLGLGEVRTHIQSGNAVFSSRARGYARGGKCSGWRDSTACISLEP